MFAFTEWVVYRDVLDLLRLLEAAEFFNPQDYNAVFEEELEKLLTRIHDPDARQQVLKMRGFDWGNYLARSLRRAGFPIDDLQDDFHAVVVKLLLSPGKVFKGWNPERHGPLERRFRASVWKCDQEHRRETQQLPQMDGLRRSHFDSRTQSRTRAILWSTGAVSPFGHGETGKVGGGNS